MIEAVLWRVLGLLEGWCGRGVMGEERENRSNGENDNGVEKDRGIDKEKEDDDWAAKVMAILDEGVIVSGAPGREELVQRLVEMMEWCLRGEKVIRRGNRRKRKMMEERGDGDSEKGMDVEQMGDGDGNEGEDWDHEEGWMGERENKKRRIGRSREYSDDEYGSDDKAGHLDECYYPNGYFYPSYLKNYLPLEFPVLEPSPVSYNKAKTNAKASILLKSPVPRYSQPTISAFEKHLRGVPDAIITDQDRTIFQTRHSDNSHDNNKIDTPKPLVITGALAHWPALTDPSRSWNDPAYLLSCALGGRRLVPVEIGRSYVDEGWGQRIVPFGEFMEKLLVERNDAGGTTDTETGEGRSINDTQQNERDKVTTNPSPKWYLAQHDLFTQFPILRRDIAVPEYCYLSGSSDRASASSTSTSSSLSSSTTTPESAVQINAWLGPANTISPLHTDPHHNILAHVVGRKYVRLYPPSETWRLYARGKNRDDGTTKRAKEKGRGMKRRGNSVESISEDRELGENNDGECDGAANDDDDDDNEEATTPTESANTSHVDVTDALTWDMDERDRIILFNNAPSDDTRGPHMNGSKQQREQHRQRANHLRQKYPLFSNAVYYETVLEPGECLFIPRLWWHYVRSLSVSFSVSFWWD